MRISPSLVVGFGIGYLLGARAGRERYDVIVREIRSLQERPELQSVAGVISAQVGGMADQVRRAVGDRFGRNTATERFSATLDHGSSNGLGTRTLG